jgi:hypothetical protein
MVDDRFPKYGDDAAYDGNVVAGVVMSNSARVLDRKSGGNSS